MKEIVRISICKEIERIHSRDDWNYVKGMITMAWVLDAVTEEEMKMLHDMATEMYMAAMGKAE